MYLFCPRVEGIHVGHTEASDVKSRRGNTGRIAIILFLNKCAVFETLPLGVLVEVTFFFLQLHSQFILFSTSSEELICLLFWFLFCLFFVFYLLCYLVLLRSVNTL